MKAAGILTPMAYANCKFCAGRVTERKVRVDHRAKQTLTVVRNVPVGVCTRCGERYYKAEVLHQLDRIAKEKIGAIGRIQVPIADYARAVAA